MSDEKFGELRVLHGEKRTEEPKVEVNVELVKMLEQLLESARTGAVIDMLALVEMPDAYACASTQNFTDPMKRIGALEAMKHAWMMKMGEDAEGR